MILIFLPLLEIVSSIFEELHSFIYHIPAMIEHSGSISFLTLRY
jgi:hypothetical protein